MYIISLSKTPKSKNKAERAPFLILVSSTTKNIGPSIILNNNPNPIPLNNKLINVVFFYKVNQCLIAKRMTNSIYSQFYVKFNENRTMIRVYGVSQNFRPF